MMQDGEGLRLPEGVEAQEKIGHGGVGDVWRGVMKVDGGEIEVAVKTLGSGATFEQEELFKHEVEATKKLVDSPSDSCPNLITVHVCNTETQTIVYEWIEQPFVKPTTMSEFVGSLPTIDALGIVRQMFLAMQQCYAVFRTNGDVKLSNFLLEKFQDDQGLDCYRLKLTDFSFADVQQLHRGSLGYISLADLTTGSIVDGSFEQFYQRRDEYGFYVSVFELLYGHKPFDISENFGDNAMFASYEYQSRLEERKSDFSVKQGSVLSKFKSKTVQPITEFFQRLILEHDKNQSRNENWLQDFEQELFALLENNDVAGIAEKPAPRFGLFGRWRGGGR